jgi:hypothetical protein
MMYTPDEPACDKSDATRVAISRELEESGFVGVNTKSIAATVEHWFYCECNVRTFLDTYPNIAIPFKNKEGRTQQVLGLIQSASRVNVPQSQTPDLKRVKMAPIPAHALASQTHSYSDAHNANKVGPAQHRSAQNPPPRPPPIETAREDKSKEADEEDLARRGPLGWTAEKHAQTIEKTKARLKELEAEKIPPRRDYGRLSHTEEIRNLKASLEFLQNRSKPLT